MKKKTPSYKKEDILIRNDEGKWIDTTPFRSEAINFMKNGYYTAHPTNSPEWKNYWQEQLDRCIKGYAIGTTKITGNHYFYLNFTQITAIKNSKDASGGKVVRFPDFWDGDYDYFWALEIAKTGLYSNDTIIHTTEQEKRQYYAYNNELQKMTEKTDAYYLLKEKRDAISHNILKRLNIRVQPHLDYLEGGHNFIVGKSRRKGYSFKNSAICVNLYNTERNRQIIIGADMSKYLYPTGTMSMASEHMDFLNAHTGWKKSRDVVNTRTHKRASFLEDKGGGMFIEQGYKSEVFAITFNANPDAMRGKDARLVLLEEAGDFHNLEAAYNAISPALRAGKFMTGQIIIFGTGGSMTDTDADFIKMFYNPIAYNIMPFKNIWDDGMNDSYCGFFHPVTLNMEGFYDEQGNTDIQRAYQYEIEKRNIMLQKSSTSSVLHKHVQEYPLTPSEAFLVTNHSPFPIDLLQRQLNKVIAENLQTKRGVPVMLTYQDGKVTSKPDFTGKLKPIYHYHPKTDDLTGSPIIYEYPIENPPKGLYKIGYDPYRHNHSGTTSLAAIYVYKGVHVNSPTRNIIVAEYVGRPRESDEVNRILMMLCELYNAECMHENEVTHVKNYFRRMKKLHLLAMQPNEVISATIKKSTVARVYGIHMTESIKEAGEKYLADWLLEIKDYDEHGSEILNLHTIYSIGLLEELIKYNRKGNYDRVISLFMIMFAMQQEELGKEYGSISPHEKTRTIYASINSSYARSYM